MIKESVNIGGEDYIIETKRQVGDSVLYLSGNGRSLEINLWHGSQSRHYGGRLAYMIITSDERLKQALEGSSEEATTVCSICIGCQNPGEMGSMQEPRLKGVLIDGKMEFGYRTLAAWNASQMGVWFANPEWDEKRMAEYASMQREHLRKLWVVSEAELQYLHPC